jgi:hypothetical protein
LRQIIVNDVLLKGIVRNEKTKMAAGVDCFMPKVKEEETPPNPSHPIPVAAALKTELPTLTRNNSTPLADIGDIISHYHRPPHPPSIAAHISSHSIAGINSRPATSAHSSSSHDSQSSVSNVEEQPA